MAESSNSNITIGSGHQAGRTKEKVHHTVTACVRCRQRKTRCDPALPRCDPCQRANAPCEYYDSSRGTKISRTYITALQESVQKLSAELKSLEVEEEDQDADYESMAKTGGLVRVNERDDSRFLGPSSGIAITRFVMDFAKQSSAGKTIGEVVPSHRVEMLKQKIDVDIAKPTSKVATVSSVLAPTLPSREVMDYLTETYMVKAQYALPLLHEPTFRSQVENVYSEKCTDPTHHFQVRLVIAISLQRVEGQWAGLADSYYLAALPYLNDAVAKMDLSTLQCFALIAQYSLLTPTRTAAYWVVGLAAKLCQLLGLCDESTIEKPPSGVPPNVLEVDMRRRLFWVITSMEYGLAHSLGRPSAFGVSVDNINVHFFQLCDDKYITSEGLLPGHFPIMKKCISIHFLRMRLLQAEIRRTLYLKKRPSPNNENDPWFANMLQRIDDWVRGSPQNDEGSGLSEAWFTGRRNTMIIMMYRPSPQIPEPSLYAAQQCYDAATFNIHLHKEQVEKKLIDITWIFTQAICMALNTVLWTLSFPSVRQQHSRDEVTLHIRDALTAIGLCAERWPGVASAQQIYLNLVDGCLKSYDNDRQVRSPGSTSIHDFSSAASQAGQSPTSTGATSYYGPTSPQSFASPLQQVVQTAHPMQNGIEQSNAAFSGQLPFTNNVASQAGATSYTSSSPSAFSQHTPYGSPGLEAQNPNNYPYASPLQPLPSWDTVTTSSLNPAFTAYSNLSADNQPWLASLGDVYSQYTGHPYGEPAAYQLESLGEQDQLDLMALLEQTPLPEVSPIAGNAPTYYNAFLP